MPSKDVIITANWEDGDVYEFCENNKSICVDPKESSAPPSLTIAPNASLTLSQIHHEQHEGAVVLQGGTHGDIPGSLIHDNSGVEATVGMFIGRYGGEGPPVMWHMISSPVQNMSIRPEFVPEGIIPPWIDFYKWDESYTAPADGEEVSGWWINSKHAGGSWNDDFEDTLLKGKGYLLAYGQPDKSYGERVHHFSGHLHAENVAITALSRTPAGQYAGWHLLGNPFASAVDWTIGDWQRQNILGGPKIWDTQHGSYTPVINIIPAMTAFMVNTSGNGSLRIPVEARVHQLPEDYEEQTGHPATHHKRSSMTIAASKTPPQVRLQARDTRGHTAQTSIILFRDDATTGFDHLYDTPFMAGHAPQLWSSPPAYDPGTGETPKLALNNLPEAHDSLSVPLGFMKNDNHLFHIKLLHNATSKTLFLEDIIHKKMHALCQEKHYPFTAEENDPPGRFFLHFTNGTPPIPSWENAQSPEPHMHATSDALHVHTWCNSCMLEVFNLRGMLVMQAPLNNSGDHRLPHNLPPGIHIARLRCATMTHARKFAVP